MKTTASVLGITIVAGALSACSFFSSQTYCLEEQEANGLDYMIVADPSVCDNPNSDAEYYSTNESFNHGDIAYIEVDGSHSVKKRKDSGTVKKVTNPPIYTPALRPAVPTPTKVCLKAYAPAPPPPPKPPVANPKPAQPAPKQQPAPVVPKAPSPTIKPGC